MRCAIAIFACAGALAAQDKPADDNRIHGTVKESNGAPVVGNTVVVNRVLTPNGSLSPFQAGMLQARESKTVGAVTDESGRYTIDELPAGSYSVRADRVPDPKMVKLDAGQDLTVDFVIPASPAISGRVVNPDNRPVDNAAVWVLCPAYANGMRFYRIIGSTATGADGAYLIKTGLEANRRYYLLVQRTPPANLKERRPIEVSTYYPSATGIDSAAAIVLQPGEARAHADIHVATAPYFCVAGKMEFDGRPMAASFAIHEAPLGEPLMALFRGDTDDAGKYRVCGLPSGAYRLSSSQSYTDFLVATSDLEHVDLSLDLASPRLQVDWDDSALPSEMPTLNAQALGTLRDLAASAGLGDYLGDEGLQKLAGQISSGTAPPEVGVAMRNLASDPESDGALANLMSSFTFPRDVSIHLSDAAGRNYFNSGGIPDGLPAGEYAVQVTAPGGGYVKRMTFDDVPAGEQIMRLAPAQTGTLRIVMARGRAKIAVTAADAAGNPSPNAAVAIVPVSAATASALSRTAIRGVTDQDGNYTSPPVPPGRYRVVAIPQWVRWDSPEDLDRILLVMYQARSVELEGNGTVQVTVAPVPIY